MFDALEEIFDDLWDSVLVHFVKVIGILAAIIAVYKFYLQYIYHPH
jgi:hypothetical protein